MIDEYKVLVEGDLLRGLGHHDLDADFREAQSPARRGCFTGEDAASIAATAPAGGAERAPSPERHNAKHAAHGDVGGPRS